MTLVFASLNLHKVGEMKLLLEDGYTIISNREAGIQDDVEETGSSFTENALIKARHTWSKLHQACFADDSGLACKALGGAPGIYSARYSPSGISAENVSLLLTNLQNEQNRAAEFICVIALITSGEEYIFEGRLQGNIALTPKGVSGFGYDPVFIPNGYDKSFSELEPQQKNRISHRAIAVEKLKAFLAVSAAGLYQ